MHEYAGYTYIHNVLTSGRCTKNVELLLVFLMADASVFDTCLQVAWIIIGTIYIFTMYHYLQIYINNYRGKFITQRNCQLQNRPHLKR